MKKEISISLLALSLAACGGSSSSSNNNSSALDPMSISSYSSDAATDTSPVGTWIGVYSGIAFIDNIEDSTYKGRELFTIKEEGDNYIITSCDDFIATSSITKTEFFDRTIVDNSSLDSTEQYTQTFTSNINFTRTSTTTESVNGSADYKWEQSTAAIKINDSTDINENISITSQNDDLATSNLEINCAGYNVSSEGHSSFNMSNDDTDIILQNFSATGEHIVYFNKDSTIEFEKEAADTGVDISLDETNNTVQNYSVTANLSSTNHTGTFNVSVDFQ